MTNLILRPLESRLKTLVEELEEVKDLFTTDRDKYEIFLKKVEAYRSVIEDLVRSGIGVNLVTTEVLHNEIESILRTEGSSLHRKVIYERLLAIGIEVKGRDPISNVGSHLSTDTRFKSCGEGMWGLNNV